MALENGQLQLLFQQQPLLRSVRASGFPVPRPGSFLDQVQGDTLERGEEHREGAAFSPGLALQEILSRGRWSNHAWGGNHRVHSPRGNRVEGRGGSVRGWFFGLSASFRSRPGTAAKPSGSHRGGLFGIRGLAVDRRRWGGKRNRGRNGPVIEMCYSGAQGHENPVITGESVFIADFADSSGIDPRGGGLRLRLFVDGVENDLGRIWTSPAAHPGRLLRLRSCPGSALLFYRRWTAWETRRRQLGLTSARRESGFQHGGGIPEPGSGTGASASTCRRTLVEVGIFTVGDARLPAHRPVQGGLQQILWNGLDADGDPPATGAYIFRLSAEAAAGGGFIREADHTGVLAVVNLEGAP